jgi:hypothetical protein
MEKKNMNLTKGKSTQFVDVGPADVVRLLIQNVDNQIIVIVNDTVAYNRKLDGDPGLNDTVEVSELLNAGNNSLFVIGFNWSGPSHYRFQLDKNGNHVPGILIDERPPGWGATIYAYTLVKR